jgi:hypothetical protein
VGLVDKHLEEAYTIQYVVGMKRTTHGFSVPTLYREKAHVTQFGEAYG